MDIPEPRQGREAGNCWRDLETAADPLSLLQPGGWDIPLPGRECWSLGFFLLVIDLLGLPSFYA